jgi:hypothetical protein
MSPRVFAVLCVTQTVALTGSYLMMRSYAQVWDRLPLDRVAEGSSWSDWMQFARWAMWPLLFVPAVLMAAGAKRTRMDHGVATIRPRWFWLCIAVTAVILCYSVAIVVVARNGPPRRVQSLNR